MICKRKENAPEFVVCNLSIKKSEFVPFINSQSGDWVNLQVLKAKSGDKIYAKLDTWEPDPAKVHADGVQQVRSTLEPQPPQSSSVTTFHFDIGLSLRTAQKQFRVSNKQLAEEFGVTEMTIGAGARARTQALAG